MDEENLKPEQETGFLKWWKQRSELEKKLLITLAIGIVLIVGMAIFSTIKPKAPPKPCTTSSCITAASLVQDYADLTVDPCDDFLKFSCGKFMEELHGDPEALPLKLLEQQVARQVKELINEPVGDDDHYMLVRQKELFGGCMDESKGEESLKIFKGILKELKGWPVVMGSLWDANSFDWTDMMVKLRRRGLYFSMLFNLGTQHDPEDEEGGKSVACVTEPYLELPAEEHKELYIKYMTDVAVEFGAKPQRAEEDMAKVYNFMEKLKEISDKAEERALGGEKNSVKLTIKEFQFHNYEVDWLKIINDLVSPAEQFSKSDFLYFPSPLYMDEFFDLIDKIPERIQANYMIWTALEDIMPLLSEQLRELQENYNYQSKKEELWSDRFEFCSKRVAYMFDIFPSTVSYARKYLPSEERDQVSELAGTIISEFKNTLSGTDWIDDESKEKVLGEVDEIVDIVGINGNYFDDALLEANDFNDYFKGMRKGPFLSMYLNSSRNNYDEWFSLLRSTNASNVLRWLSEGLPEVSKDALLLEDNFLMLPVVFLQGSFHSDQPMFVNYAELGLAIASALSERLASHNEDLWNQKIKDGACEDLETPDDKNSTDDMWLLAQIAGAKVSYAAYRNWVAENGEEGDLIGVEYTPNQLFWISAMAYQCSRFEEDDLSDLSENYEAKVLQATAFARNSEDFGNDFGCSTDAPMSPKDKCVVF